MHIPKKIARTTYRMVAKLKGAITSGTGKNANMSTRMKDATEGKILSTIKYRITQTKLGKTKSRMQVIKKFRQ